MTLTKRIVLLWRVFKLVPKLDNLDRGTPRLEALEWAIPKMEALERFLPKLEHLESVLLKVEEVDKLIVRLDSLGNNLVDKNGLEPVVVVKEPNTVNINDWKRLKTLLKFIHLKDKAREIELEIQQVEQDRHNADFFNQVYLGKKEPEVAYKSGFVDGMKWCVNRFS